MVREKHTDETKNKMRLSALKSKHRRLVKSTKNYLRKDGTTIKLDSSWEELLAIRLDELNIKWVRPNPIEREDDNRVMHNYFPDFYLPEYDLYLDPKNPQAVKIQSKKIEVLLKTYDNIIFLYTEDEIKNYSPVPDSGLLNRS